MRILILSQEYPAPGADFVFSHAADVANELLLRGHQVAVLATSRGKGRAGKPGHSPEPRVNVQYLPLTWFGRSVPFRITAAVSYFLQVSARILLGQRPDVLVVSTAPPMIGPVAAAAAAVRRVPIVFWAMDLNPDQLAALGKISAHGILYRFLAGCMAWFVSRCSGVIALDHAMASRLTALGANTGAVAIIPPWADDRQIHPPPAEHQRFRKQWGVTGSRILLYSGNLSPSNPVAALIAGFESLPPEHDLSLVFMGDGGLHGEVAAASHRDPSRIAVVPREPAADLGAAFAAADIHVATMGPRLAGILHPSKVYSALAAGRPVLFVGPEDSPSARLLRDERVGWVVPHDPACVGAVLTEIAALSTAEIASMGARCRRLSAERFAQRDLTRKVADCVEAAGGAIRLERGPGHGLHRPPDPIATVAGGPEHNGEPPCR